MLLFEIVCCWDKNPVEFPALSPRVPVRSKRGITRADCRRHPQFWATERRGNQKAEDRDKSEGSRIEC